MKFLIAILLFANVVSAAPTDPTGYADVTAVAFSTSATVSGAVRVPLAKMVALTLNKTGAGKGTVKFQGSTDAITWKDINITTYPDATSTIAANTASAVISLIANPFLYIRWVFTEDGTGEGTITGGRWVTK